MFLKTLLAVTVLAFATAGGAQDANLARQAHASASEFYQDMTADRAADGTESTRWSGIPGHNSGVWYELDWDTPVEIGEVLIQQYQRYTFEMDVQTWDATKSEWRTVRHFGRPNVKLPGVLLCTLDPAVRTSKIRIANITNGPSFTEVQAFGPAHRHPSALALASDLRGNFVGMVCDGVGAAPITGKEVTLQGKAAKGLWKATATSDEHGMFFIAMPLGLVGDVKAQAAGVEPRWFHADRFQRAITPLDTGAKPTVLDRGWRFTPDPPKDFAQPEFDDHSWAAIKVPAHWEMEGFRSREGVGGYRAHFISEASGGRLMLRFDGVYSGAQVWLNGKPIAYHEGGFTPFEADITDLVKVGDNVIALRVTEHTNVSDNLDKMSLYADFPLAGIIRKVTLFRVPDVHIEAFEETCQFGSDGATVQGTVSVISRLLHAVPGASLTVQLRAPDGKIAAQESYKIQKLGSCERNDAAFALKVKNPQGWTAEHPTLYTLQLTLASDGQPLQTLRQPIGLRETTVVGPALLINGSPVKFRGTCHHDSHPLMGRAVTPELTQQDMELIKGANLNSVRTSHYPPIPELVDDADRIGLYVEDEASFCWVGAADDLRNTPQIIQLTGELLARDRNHPSVFMWSLCNESSFGFGFERSHEWVRKVDPSRPTGAATSAWLEIATLHNPISIQRIQENETLDKPMFFDEAWCIYQGIFGDVAEMWVDPGMRDYYAEPLPAIWDVFMKSKSTQGSMIWAWSDDIFCVPNRGLEYGRETARSHFIENSYLMPRRGLVGDAPWGVVDGWRRPKPEYWITKKLQSPIKIREVALAPDREARIAVDNQYDFTNLSELTITYSRGASHGTVRANVAPRHAGTITVPPGMGRGPLRLVFRDSTGSLVDEFAFPLPVSPTPQPAVRPSAAGTIDIREETTLAGDSTHLIGKNFEVAFDKSSGAMRRCVAQGQPLLLEFPAVHILPTNAPTHAVPESTAWNFENMTISRSGGSVIVVLKGSYPDLTGSYDLTITPDGAITVVSKFTYTGKPMLAREVGMRIAVPRSCNLLSWDRIAEWGAYPGDHIGRPVGTARAFSAQPTTVPPKGPWSQDNSPMGTNDFRSTKRHIRSGQIAYADGGGVAITSDGQHSLRAYVDTDRINVFVNDWYGGTNVGWGEWITNYGRGREIKTGELLESTLHLRLR